MNLYVTEVRTKNGVFGGPEVPGITITDAQAYCNRNGLGYLTIVGRLIARIPVLPGETEPPEAYFFDPKNN